MRPNPYTTHSSKYVYENPWMKVREDTITHPDGTPGMYGVIETNDSVIIIAVREDGKICLLDMYRYPTQNWSLQLPGGGGDKQEPLIAAQRELAEESGLVSDDWHKLGNGIMLQGLLTETLHVFVAQNVTFKLGIAEPREAEGIDKIVYLSKDEIDQKIMNDEIVSANTITALYLYDIWLKSNNRP